jgi:sterol desaturase/sphingolipid hydroxylase (fatty acid hydroxylase superfamily)
MFRLSNGEQVKAMSVIKGFLWPGLLGLCLALTAAGFASGNTLLTFNLVYLSLLGVLLLLERVLPFERRWLGDDGQTSANILHTLSSKATLQALVLFSGTIGVAGWVTSLAEDDTGLWPRHLPLWTQVVLGALVAEFMLYWAHRLAHETRLLWRLHAIHHSVTRLWVVNTGRFHVLDSLFKVLMAMAPLVVLGAPFEVLEWMAVITAYVGLMTHCNVDMHCGLWSVIFNTPNAHRWHHSRIPAEGDRNYGENLLVWDWMFGTWFLPSDRRPPADIGIEGEMPLGFLGQLAYPFLGEQRAVSGVPANLVATIPRSTEQS